MRMLKGSEKQREKKLSLTTKCTDRTKARGKWINSDIIKTVRATDVNGLDLKGSGVNGVVRL